MKKYRVKLIFLLALVMIIYPIIRLIELEKRCILVTLMASGERHAGYLNEDDVATIFFALVARCSLAEEGRTIDSRGEYEIVQDLAAPSEKPGPFDVTLITQCSYDHLIFLISLVARWQGPISVAVFTENDKVAEALWDIANLIACDSMIRMHVSFHLVFPLLQKNTLVPIAPSLLMQERCQWVDSTEQNFAKKSIYPTNLLRNVPRMNITTDFFMTIDVDLLPNANLRQDFISFAMRNNLSDASGEVDRKVFVVPVFEVKSGVSAPFHKDELMSLLDSGEARPFYSYFCDRCQEATRYEDWRRETTSAQLSSSYEVAWQPIYEPYYIAQKNIPPFDERFKQYGFERTSLACELHIAGRAFAVLNNAFLIHQGWKSEATYHPDKEKDLEQNEILFDQFKQYLKIKYPESSRQCE